MAKAKETAPEATEEVQETKAPKPKHDPGLDKVTVTCFTPITINGKEYFGDVTVTRNEADSIIEMLSKKKASDGRVHIGREFERSRVDGALVVRDAHTKQRVE